MRRTLFLVMAPLAVVVGCAVPQAQNTPVWQRLETDSVIDKDYYLYVPSTYRHDRPAPVVVTCHGTPPYDIAEHHIREWKMLGEQNGCIILAPKLIATDGLLGDGPLVGMIYNERRILSILSSLGYRFNIDKANIMITGFSGGGFPTYWVGLRHPDVFSVIAARSANFSQGNVDGWFQEQHARQTAVLVYYGSNDFGAIQGQSENAIQFLRAKGLTVQTQVIGGLGHQRRPEIAMAFFRKNWKPSIGSLGGQAAVADAARRGGPH